MVIANAIAVVVVVVLPATLQRRTPAIVRTLRHFFVIVKPANRQPTSLPQASGGICVISLVLFRLALLLLL